MKYEEFIKSKQFRDVQSGFEQNDLNENLKDFQELITRWALARGRAAIFADTGLGKTLMQIEWAEKVHRHTSGSILIFAPLAVADQTIGEAEKFNVMPIRYVRSDAEITEPGMYITNYEMQHHFDPSIFSGVVLDESSILKNQTGKTRTEIIERWGSVPYRLSCTATPSPNDFMELGNQAQFLGIMSMTEMLAMFFVNDTGDTGTWRLKGHAKAKFFEWLSTWAVVIRKPSDLGFSDEGYELPPLNIIEHEIETAEIHDGELFARPASTMNERRKAKRNSIKERCELVANIVNNSDEEWIVWCHLNDESALLAELIPDATEVRGADDIETKQRRLIGFTHGEHRVLVSKPSICGFGMNWQHAHNMFFVGIDDSFEKFYQAVRREYRFGQEHEVNVHLAITDSEGAVRKNIERKQVQHEELSQQMVMHMRAMMKKEVAQASIEKTIYAPKLKMKAPEWLKEEVA